MAEAGIPMLAVRARPRAPGAFWDLARERDEPIGSYTSCNHRPGRIARSHASLLTFIVLASAAQAQAPELVPAPYLSPKYLAPQNAPSSIVVAGPDEPGERLVVTGRVIDGTKLIAGASVYVFHTDVKGRYAPDRSGPDAELDPRLHGAHCAPMPRGGTGMKPSVQVAMTTTRLMFITS